MIQVEKLSYSFPDKDLYKKVSFTLEDGQHCAFIGSNGTGKTTLIDMIMDTEKYLYDGKITKDATCRIGYVSQFAVRDKNQDISVFDYLSEVFVKNQEETAIACEEMATAEDMDVAFEKYQKLLDEFQAMDGDNYESNIYRQLKTADMHQREHVLLSQLSGGEYKLVQIMKEMLLQPNLLVMDEPDVFLDFDNMNSLCKLINSHRGTLLVITHNRYLLNHCFNKILHLENEDIQEFDGNYTDYNFALLQKKIEIKEQSIEDQKEIERNEDMVNRMRTTATNMSIASLGRTVHARQTHLDRLKARAIKAPFLDIHEPEIKFPEVDWDALMKIGSDEAEEESAVNAVNEATENAVTEREIPVVLKVDGYKVAFEEDLLTDVSFEMKAGEKVAIVGPNGTGKSTLLNAIYRNYSPAADGVSDVFMAKNPVIQFGEKIKVGFLEQIQGEKLSGGELNLLQLQKLADSEANLLLLDEPTSHLDMWAQIALEKALSAYKGSVLMVSHDFYNIVNCVDYVLYIENNTVRRMRIRSFRQMIYEKHFNKDYLEIEQKKKELETRITTALKNSDLAAAKGLCEELEEVIEKLNKCK